MQQPLLASRVAARALPGTTELLEQSHSFVTLHPMAVIANHNGLDRSKIVMFNADVDAVRIGIQSVPDEFCERENGLARLRNLLDVIVLNLNLEGRIVHLGLRNALPALTGFRGQGAPLWHRSTAFSPQFPHALPMFLHYPQLHQISLRCLPRNSEFVARPET
jgi:hypothetical protein